MRNGKRVVAALAVMVFSGALVFACSTEDEAAGVQRPTTPSPDASTGAGDASADSSIPPPPPGACDRAGGAQGVGGLADQIYTAAAADCRIGIYFTRLNGQSSTHVKDCMRVQLQDIFDCPGVDYEGSKSSTGRDCRNMSRAHQNLIGANGEEGLNEADFTAYVQIAATALRTGGVNDQDLAAVVGALNGFQGAVTRRNVTTYNTNCTCENGVYEGKACVPDGGYILPDAEPDAPLDAPPDAVPDAPPDPPDAGDDGSDSGG